MPIRPDDEPLWRGVTMLHYEGGRWIRQAKGTQAVVSFKTRRPAQGKAHPPADQARADRFADVVRHPPDLERLRPSFEQISALLINNDGTLFRSDLLSGEYDYEVISDRDTAGYQIHESPPSDEGQCLPVDARRLASQAQGDRRARSSRTSIPDRPMPSLARPARWKPISANPVSSVTRCRWTSSTRNSTPSKISWSTARRAIVSISPVRWPSCCARWAFDLESSTASKEATGTS